MPCPCRSMGAPAWAGKQTGYARSGTHDCRGTGARATAHAMTAKPSLPLVAVLNGPNLNMLGLRQPEIYGSATLDDVEALCAEIAEALGLAIDFRQTNGEGELVTWVQEFRGRAAGIVINPAGYRHTSVALLDALL